jgi:hypothetical protein
VTRLLGNYPEGVYLPNIFLVISIAFSRLVYLATHPPLDTPNYFNVRTPVPYLIVQYRQVLATQQQHKRDKETNKISTAGVSHLLSVGNGQVANICASASFLRSAKRCTSEQMCVHIAVSWKILKRGSAIFCAHRHTQHTE